MHMRKFMEGTRGDDDHLQAQEGCLGGHTPSRHLGLRLQPPDPQDSPFLSLKPLSMWDFVTGALANPYEDLPEKGSSEQ